MKTLTKLFLFSIIAFKSYGQRENYCAKSRLLTHNKTAVVADNVTQLERKYDVKHHHFNLSVSNTNKYIEGWVRTVAVIQTTTLDTFAFELHPQLTIDSIIFAGNNMAFSRVGNAVFMPFPFTLGQGFEIDAKIYYKGTAVTQNGAAIGDGYNNGFSNSWGNQVTWSLSQPYSAYEWWPCKQQLTDKIDSIYMQLSTSATNKVGSNGKLISTEALPDNRVRYNWKSNTPINYYLISIAVAQYVEHSFYAHPINSDSVFVQNYIYNNPQTLPNFLDEINSTASMLELFATQAGPYPFANEKYGHSMAPFSGGMEHQTMTSQGFFNLTLTAHELFHQWFGDNVTCKTWSDIFVNEGFASYGEYLALQSLEPGNQAQHMLQVQNSVTQQPGGSIWFADTSNVNRIFSSRLSYDKGSAVIHMLRYEINNDSLFFASLKAYQAKFANSNATCDDMRHVVDSITGQDYTTFFNQWIYGEGYPSYYIRWNKVGDSLIVVSEQSSSMPQVTPFFDMNFDIKFQPANPNSTFRFHQTQPIQRFSRYYTSNAIIATYDPLNWLLDGNETIVKDLTLGTNLENEKETITVMPNPVHDVLYIKNAKYNNVTSQLYDIKGALVLTSTHEYLPIEMLENGIYNLHIISNKTGETTIHKIVKQ
jgi:aminopeptidase N